MNYQINKKYSQSLNIESLRNLLNESNSLLKDTQGSVKIISDKSNDLFKISIVVLTALVGYVFSSTEFSLTLILAIYYIIVLGITIVRFYNIVYPKLNALLGTPPQKIFDDKILTGSIEENEKQILFIMLQSKQNSINNNLNLHRVLLAKYKSIISLTVILFIISIFIFLSSHLCLALAQYKC